MVYRDNDHSTATMERPTPAHDAAMEAERAGRRGAGIRDIVGGRSGEYEQELAKARTIAMQEMQERAQAIGANAIIGIDLDYETVGQGGSMLMVTASGTAVTVA